MLILIYIIIALAVVGVGAVIGNGIVESRRLSTLGYKEKFIQEQVAHGITASKLNISERGLRKIANGVAGNPALEAQVVLDDIENVKAIG
jgi:hypothetical protein